MIEEPRERIVRWTDPRPAAQAARDRSGLDALRGLLDGSIPPAPIAALMNFRLVEVEAGRVVFAGEPAEYH